MGLILVPKILMAAMSRQNVPEEQRKPFYIYVDEFQNFATPDFAQILSEARKFGLSLTVAESVYRPDGRRGEECDFWKCGNIGVV